jgi:hypothetical protein
MADSQLFTLRRILKTCAKHGILNSQLKPCSSKLKTVLTSQRPEGLQLERHKKLSSAYSKIFKSGKFNSACRRWDEKLDADKTCSSFKIYFAAAYRQHRQMQGETVASQGFANAAVTQTSEHDLAEQALWAFANLAAATAVDLGVVAQLTESNSLLAKQLEDNSTYLKEVKALLKKERA